MADTFADKLQQAMEKRLLTDEKAAELAGVSISSIKRYRNGATPALYNAALIAEAFGWTTAETAEALRSQASAGREPGTGNRQPGTTPK